MLASSKNRDTNQPFNDVAIAFHAITMVLAGYETTGNSLGFTLYQLAKHPEC